MPEAQIITVEEGRLKLTPECFIIPELKAIIDKHGLNAEPYILYVYYKTKPTSAYLNIPEDELDEVIISDIITTVGNFEPDDELVQPALDKLNTLFTTTTKFYYESLKFSVFKMGRYLRDNPIVAGKDGNLSEIIRIHKEGGGTIKSFKEMEKIVDDEIKARTRGDVDTGMYDEEEEEE